MAKKKVNSEYDNRIGAEFSANEKQKPSGLKIAAFVVIILDIIIGMQAATQEVAYQFMYDKALGTPIFDHYYGLWNFLIWFGLYGKSYPQVFTDAMNIMYLWMCPSAAFLVFVVVKESQRLKSDKYLHGSARWANLKDIQDAALLPPKKELKLDMIEWQYKIDHWKGFGKRLWMRLHPKPKHERPGVFVGSWINPKDHKYWYLRDYSKTHVLMIAKTRSGKGVGPINDTVGSWKDSMFVYDIKGELWALFSGRRKEMGQYTMRFAPRTRRRDMNAIYGRTGEVIGRKFANCIYNESETKGDDSLLACEETVKGKKIHVNVEYATLTYMGQSVSVMNNGVDQNDQPLTAEELLKDPARIKEIRGLIDTNTQKIAHFGRELKEELWNTVRWNPFDTIRYEGATEYFYVRDPTSHKGHLEARICDGSREVADTQNVAELIVNPDGKAKDDHWTNSASSFIQAAIIYVLHNLPELACPKAVDMLIAGMIDLEKLAKMRREGTFHGKWEELPKLNSMDAMKSVYAEMAKGLDWQGKPYKAGSIVNREALKQYNRPKDEGGSVLSTAQRFFAIYADPIVAEATSKSDFDIKQLMNMEHPCSIFMVVQPEDKDSMRPLVRLLINRILRMLAADMEFEGGRSINGFNHRLLMMIDEMPTLGKLDILQEALGYMAGYGLKAFMVTQDITQLKDIYGDKESIRANCQVKMYYATSNEETAREMSAEFGTTTRSKESVSISGSGLKASKSRSIQEIARPLLSVDECMNLRGAITAENGDILKAGAMAIKATGFPGIMGEQPLYFQNSELRRRASLPTLRGSDTLLTVNPLTKHTVSVETEKEKTQSKAPTLDLNSLNQQQSQMQQKKEAERNKKKYEALKDYRIKKMQKKELLPTSQQVRNSVQNTSAISGKDAIADFMQKGGIGALLPKGHRHDENKTDAKN